MTSKTVYSHSPAAQICFDCPPNLPGSYLLAAEKGVSQLKCCSRVWLHSTTASTMASMSYSLLHPLTSNFQQIGGSCSSFLFLAYMPQTVTDGNQLRGVLNNLAEHQQECAPNSASQIVKTLQLNSDLHPPPDAKSAEENGARKGEQLQSHCIFLAAAFLTPFTAVNKRGLISQSATQPRYRHYRGVKKNDFRSMCDAERNLASEGVSTSSP